MGSSWISFCPVAAAQSTSFIRSWNSPTPKLSSLRREKTGTATPAPRQWPSVPLGATTGPSLESCRAASAGASFHHSRTSPAGKAAEAPRRCPRHSRRMQRPSRHNSKLTSFGTRLSRALQIPSGTYSIASRDLPWRIFSSSPQDVRYSMVIVIAFLEISANILFFCNMSTSRARQGNPRSGTWKR